MEPHRKINPYIVGDWIKRDEDFFGRADLIEKYISLDRQFHWLVGSRRMGKTSLLRYLQRQYRKNSEFLPIFWDVSGANSAEDLKLSLLDSLEACISDFDRFNIDLDIEQMEEESIPNIFRWLNRISKEHELKIIFLIDESEAFFHVAAYDMQFFNRLKTVMLNNPDFYFIIASNHGLSPSDNLNIAHFSASFLQAFLPADYLTRWNLDETRFFLQKCGLSVQEQERIIEISGCLPFLVQMICFHRFESGDLDSALTKIKQDHILDLFFRDDFQHFSRQDCQILAEIGYDEPVSLQDLATTIGDKFSIIEKRISMLDWLGFITLKENDALILSNEFLRDWMNLNFLPTFHYENHKISVKNRNENHQLRIDIQDNKIIIRQLESDIQINRIEFDTSIDISKYVVTYPITSSGTMQIGQKLFHEIFRNNESLSVYEKLIASQNRVDFIFSISEKLNQLPIEFLHDGNDFVVLQTKLYRGNNRAILLHKFELPRKINVLLIASDTPPSLPLADNEILSLKNQLEKIAEEKNIDLNVSTIPSMQADYKTVMNFLGTKYFQIIHYAGHCSADPTNGKNYVYLWEKPRKSCRVFRVSAEELFAEMEKKPVFFYLNACQSGGIIADNFHSFAEIGLSQGVRAFIGNRYNVEDQLSAEFAINYYEQLIETNLDFAEALLKTRSIWAKQYHTKNEHNIFCLSQILWQNK